MAPATFCSAVKCSTDWANPAPVHLHLCLLCLGSNVWNANASANARTRNETFSISCVGACLCICLDTYHTCIFLHLHLCHMCEPGLKTAMKLLHTLQCLIVWQKNIIYYHLVCIQINNHGFWHNINVLEKELKVNKKKTVGTIFTQCPFHFPKNAVLLMLKTGHLLNIVHRKL